MQVIRLAAVALSLMFASTAAAQGLTVRQQANVTRIQEYKLNFSFYKASLTNATAVVTPAVNQLRNPNLDPRLRRAFQAKIEGQWPNVFPPASIPINSKYSIAQQQFMYLINPLGYIAEKQGQINWLMADISNPDAEQKAKTGYPNAVFVVGYIRPKTNVTPPYIWPLSYTNVSYYFRQLP